MPPRRRTQTTQQPEQLPDNKETEKPNRRHINITQIALWVGLISGIITLLYFANDIVGWISSIGTTSSATMTTIPPTPTLEGSLEPLPTGMVEISITSLSRTFRLGYNFKLGKFAFGNTPADIIFMNCSAESPFFDLYCDLHGTHLWNNGNTHLSDIVVPDSRGVDTLPNEVLEVGETYVLRAYDGHLVKFRISNLQLVLADELPTGAYIVVEYVYQPNDRDDFLGP